MYIMCNLNPDHITNIQCKNKKKLLYLKIIKALYGCIESDILWCELYANTLKN